MRYQLNWLANETDITTLEMSLDNDFVQDSFLDLVFLILCETYPSGFLQFLIVLTPVLMKFSFLTLGIEPRDFNVPKALLEEAQKDIQKQSFIFVEIPFCVEYALYLTNNSSIMLVRYWVGVWINDRNYSLRAYYFQADT